MGKFVDITNKKFGKLTVIAVAGRNNQGEVLWQCKCDCGGDKITTGTRLRKGLTRSCGCLQLEQRRIMGKSNLNKGRDLTGSKFGRWTVLSKNGKTENGFILYKCRCECGRIKTVQANTLTSGKSTSCGCRAIEVTVKRNLKHGLSYHPLYHVIADMIQRCHNPNDKGYSGYGARGITVCDEWRYKKDTFIKWALNNGYAPGLQIDRIDNDKGYYPDNCRFVQPVENSNNKRNTLKTTLFGKIKSCYEIAKEYGLSQDLVRTRIHKGLKDSELIKGGK